jgi:hypothetical protein
MILTDSRQEFETQFVSTRLRICFWGACVPRAGERVLALFSAVPPYTTFEKASFGTMPKLGRRGERYSRILFG